MHSSPSRFVPSSFSGANAPCIPPGLRIYTVGDVHGRDDLLASILTSIRQDRRDHPIARCQIIFLGDYIDRGPFSRQVVDRLLDGPGEWSDGLPTDWICLRGNHEDQAMRFLHDARQGQGWLLNGGMETLRSYIGGICHDLDGDLAALHMVFSRSVPPAHVRFLARRPLWHVVGDYFFVHAGIRPNLGLERQSPWDLLWIRQDFLMDCSDHGKVIVHGHSISEQPEIKSNRIGIDTGAYDTGCLTCLILEGNQIGFLQTDPNAVL
jgi:serine/threonine protein phosphatase 1